MGNLRGLGIQNEWKKSIDLITQKSYSSTAEEEDYDRDIRNALRKDEKLKNSFDFLNRNCPKNQLQVEYENLAPEKQRLIRIVLWLFDFDSTEFTKNLSNDIQNGIKRFLVCHEYRLLDSTKTIIRRRLRAVRPNHSSTL